MPHIRTPIAPTPPTRPGPPVLCHCQSSNFPVSTTVRPGWAGNANGLQSNKSIDSLSLNVWHQVSHANACARFTSLASQTSLANKVPFALHLLRAGGALLGPVHLVLASVSFHWLLPECSINHPHPITRAVLIVSTKNRSGIPKLPRHR